MHLTDSAAWARSLPSVEPTAEQLLLTAAVESVLIRLDPTAPNPRTFPARQILDVNGASVTLLTAAENDRIVALVASHSYVERQWLSKATPIVQPQNLTVSVLRPGNRASDSLTTVRAASETGLPWTVAIDVLDAEAEHAGLRQRQSLWVAGLVILALLALTATWIVARAVSRELAVARLQSDFVAAVSHEFRTPLTTMGQMTEMLIDGRAPDDARQRRYLLALSRQTDRLRRLVESLLDFGRMEAGTSPYRRQPLDVSEWIGTVVEQFRQDSASRGHRIHLRLSTGRTNILGDRDALTNALWNVLDNAVKYSPNAADVWIDVHRSQEQIAIEVRDAGLGIARDEQRDIFRRFVRGTRAKADNISGTGIGLAIVRHVVAAHDGDVTVRSAPDEGSTFTLTLPAAPEESPACLAS
jgi:signal transduction histidine kinase